MATPVDAHSNFAFSTVATAPATPLAGTSLVVQAGDGAKFPAVSFNAVAWPPNTQPSTVNAEIVRVTNVATDTLTITRTQEGSTNQAIGVGWNFAATITKKTLTDIETYLLRTHSPVAINSTNTITAAQAATGYITSTSAAATTLTLPTGTLLGAQISAVQGTILDLYIDNTAGASLVTIAVAVNGILSAAAAANAASQGLLTVPSGVTGQACFRLMFSSATAYTFTRIA